MSSPSTTPPAPAPHSHKGGKCPVSGASGLGGSGASASDSAHAFCPPREGDIRSVCPALNTMANHGYIHRDGQNLSASHVSAGLRACYSLSLPLSLFLAHVGFFLLGKAPFQNISLHDVSLHNKVEHDASLVHHDTPEGETYAPEEIDGGLVERLMGDIEPSKAELLSSLAAGGSSKGDDDDDDGKASPEAWLMSTEDVARARVRRETECRPIGSAKQEIARGEMSIILQVWGRVASLPSSLSPSSSPSSTSEDSKKKKAEKTGAPAEWIKRWLSEERLPEGWKPTKTVGLGDVIKQSKAIKLAVGEIRKKAAAEAEAAKTKAPASESS